VTRPKLLLADDSVTIRKVVELTFADEGIDVTTVADGDTAMSKFLEIQPEIVLVDVGLPGTNGYQICEMIKGDESTSRIPVLLLVGSFEPFDQDAAEKSGADGFLTKPFHSIRDLVNRVHELLGTQQQKGIDNVIDFDLAAAGDDENVDIDDLYERSFAETMPIENYETVPAFAPEDAFPEQTNADGDAARTSNEVEGEGSVIDEPIAEAKNTFSEETFDASHHSVEEWLDDEMIETISSAKPEELQEAEQNAVGAALAYEQAPAAAVDIEPVKEFDWSPEALVTGEDGNEAAVYSADLDHDVRHADNGAFGASPEHSSEIVEHSTPPAETLPEPSPEMIDLIVSRVMERLSDRAVRDVAQEAVPRIAEKLMREALEEDRNR
jgi:DNA-binding response OmpR family regulator